MAAEVWHTSTIKKVYPLGDGSFVLTFDSNAAACTSPVSDHYYHVVPSQNGMTDEGARKIYAAAMAAMAMDKTVQVAFDDSTPNCFVNRLIVVK